MMYFAQLIVSIALISCSSWEVQSQDELTFDEGLEQIARWRKLSQSNVLSQYYSSLTNNLLTLTSNKNLKENLPDIRTVDSQANPLLYNVTDACMHDVEISLNSLASGELYALSMLDATGKPGSDFLRGNLHWLGSYSECRQIKPSINKTRVEPFQTQYCAAFIPIDPTNPQSVVILGLCVPDSCTEEDVRALTNTALSVVSLKATSCQCQTDLDKRPLDGPAIGVLCMLSIFGILILCGSLYDLVYKYRTRILLVSLPVLTNTDHVSVGSDQLDDAEPENSENTPLLHSKHISPRADTNSRSSSVVHRILLSFSVFTNGDKVLTVGAPSESNLGAIHGIRFLSMSWVILGHTYFFAMASFKNPSYLLTSMAKRFSFQAILNATVSVDSFFVLSGTLVAYLLLREIESKDGPKRVSWWKFYIHRYWRLTPPYMLILGTNVALFSYIGEGPLWPMNFDGFCRTNWWTNLLYINNLVYPNEMCFGWSWFLANDMQFFILSPLLVVPFVFSSIAGVVVNGLFLLASMIATGIITHKHGYPADIPAFLAYHGPPANNVNYMKDVYMAPWCRIGPYVIGVLAGYILHRTKRSVNMHWGLVLLGWIVAAVLNTSVLYGLYNVANGHALSAGVNAFYAATHRNVWALGLVWVIFACCTGHGGPVNRLLSWSALVPLSRLTYMAYLIHPIIMVYFYSSMEAPLVLSDINMIYLFLGHMAITYGIAFVVSLTFEAPMIGLEKIVFPRD